jgi:tRNA A37 threonylcarbamoyladenosine biosynthesis protein TsaE
MGKGEISENKTEQIGRILNAINTKPFIILSGISGTGKTQIARIISAGMVKGSKGKGE